MKTVIITGSTSGIGLGIAENFARSDYNVVLNGLGQPDEIEATRSRLAALGDGEVIEPSVSVPIENPQSPAAVAEAEPALDPLDPSFRLNGFRVLPPNQMSP